MPSFSSPSRRSGWFTLSALPALLLLALAGGLLLAQSGGCLPIKPPAGTTDGTNDGGDGSPDAVPSNRIVHRFRL